MDLNKVLRSLSVKRPVFYSEADMQFALAWEIKEIFPEAFIRLEKPIDGRYTDLFVYHREDIIAIELKYKTAKLLWIDLNQSVSETFDLKDQSAPDLGRFDYLKDIERNEILIRNKHATKGYTVFITNYDVYWKGSSFINYRTNGDEFRLDEGIIQEGQRLWSNKTKLTSVGKVRLRGIFLNGRYKMKWETYSEVSSKGYNVFKYLLHEQK